MKKICCVLLCLLLCFSLCSCTEKSSSEDDYIYDDNYMSGEIVDKISSSVLVIKPSTPRIANEWGNTVYVFTDDADDFCVGDSVSVYISKAFIKNLLFSVVTAEEIDELRLYDKPIIYLYPQVPTVCSVKINLDGNLTCTYPAYRQNGWENFTAYPDGTLVFPDKKEYYALYWEGLQNAEWDFSKGFCVKGEDTVAFLEWALSKQGLTPREANEFIIYWLPFMEKNPYNVISFQTSAYTDTAALDITPKPDSLLRIFMVHYPSASKVDIEPQELSGFTREGFVVVEWGGSQVNK